MSLKYLFFAKMLFLTFILSGQLPDTELYMFDYKTNGINTTISNPVMLSGFNEGGYNNQPAFAGPDNVYITSNLYDKQYTDIIRLDLREHKYYRITATEGISEFSPTPKAPGGHFGTVRIEKDGNTQTLWLYPRNHSNGGHRVFEGINNIGYYCWLGGDKVAFTTVWGETMHLYIGNIKTGDYQKILENVGRCLQIDGQGKFYFVHKMGDDRSYIKTYDFDTNKAKIITRSRPDSEDFTIAPGGVILMGEGSRIHSFSSERGTWKEEVNLADYGITKITRMAISRGKLIIVNKGE